MAVSSVTRHTTDTTLALLLSENPRPGDTITISYSVPRTNPIQDEAGNDAAAFSEQAVTNNLAATAPEAPGNLTATAGTDADTMVLTWETPWANGRDIEKFQVRYAQGSTAGRTWADILNSDADTTTHTVTELTTGAEYTFEVHAVNGIGNGAAATVTATTVMPTWELTLTDLNGNAVTELVEGGASATVTVRITNGVTFTTAQTVTLSWGDLALDATSRIQGAGGASAITIPPGQSSGTLVISAPDPGGVAAYASSRTAPLWRRHDGRSRIAIAITFRDDEDPPVATLTAQPAQVSEGGTINVEISLNLPFGAHATSTLSLVVTDADGALVAPLPTEAAFDSGELTHALTLTADDNAVQNDSAREVTVALVENPDVPPYTLGEPSSVTVTVLDNDTPPSAPRNLAAEARDGEARLTWQAPLTDNGQAVPGYDYRQKAGTGAFGAWVDISGSNVNTTEYTVTSLANGTLYTFEVQAENTAGQSGPSNQASATPVAGDTTAPVLMSATTTALELGLTYDEDLDADSEPAPSAFTVTVDGASRGVTEVSVRIPVIPITDSGVIPITDSMLSDHQSERSDAGVPLWGEVIGLVQRSVCLSHGFSFQVELVGVVDEPVEDGVCEGGIPDHGMPALHGQLRGHDRGAQSMAVLDDLEQVAAVLGAELRHPPVVDDQDGGLGDRGEQLGIAPVGARDGQLGEQAWEAPVRGGVSVAARAVSEGAGYPTLSHAGRPRDQDVEVVTDPAPVGQRQDEVAVEASGLAEVDVLDAGRVTEPGAAQPVGELARGALGELAVDNEPEAFLEAEGLDLG